MQRILVISAGFAGLWSALAAARRLEVEGKTGLIEVRLSHPTP
jgi:NADH dehydrogenase